MSERPYDPSKIEPKWQKKWEEEQTYKTPENPSKNKKYILDMFPYPSGSGLHVGHIEGYTGSDVLSRFYRMQGYDVLHPMGWDAFGLPAENYAIKTGVPPKDSTAENINNFKGQIRNAGLSYDWTREISTADPDYYKWTQWLFLELFRNNLAYKKKAQVLWCPNCQTVLANEQVITKDDKNVCERCDTEVIHKDLEQWFFRITDYADALIDDLDTVDWPESTKTNQKNWIGRSSGAYITFKIKGQNESVRVFTTRPDTLYGATYLVLAPDSELAQQLVSVSDNQGSAQKYAEAASKKTDVERMVDAREKTGIQLEGIYAINPANNSEIPVYLADYVLSSYGTGAIMAVPAHDERDFAFAQKFDLPIIEVVEAPDSFEGVYSGRGMLKNSDEFDGRDSQDAKRDITEKVGGELTTIYRLRDWLVSRQRYWGPPIPIVYDPEGNPHPVPEEYLPWVLPTDVEYQPKGVSPLASSNELKQRVEKIFGKGWTPETDTLDTFVDSSWYFLRFCDPHNSESFASEESLMKWVPVDLYEGGAEHTVLHLMYARFITKALNDLGYLGFTEPFLALRHPGTILAEDGRDMSKRYGNVVNPDDVIAQVGGDALRMFELFMGPFDATKSWNTGGVKGVYKFLERVWNATLHIVENDPGTTDPIIVQKLHQTIKKVTSDIQDLRFNTAIASLMELLNDVRGHEYAITRGDWGKMLRLLAPFAPYITEELWQEHYASQDQFASIHQSDWPQFDEAFIKEDVLTIPVQVNGKLRGTLEITSEKGEDETTVVNAAKQLENVKTYVEEGSMVKIIFIPGTLVNFVVKG